MDTFSRDWSREMNLLVPPTHLVIAALEHLQIYKAKAILITLWWPSQRFWPFLFGWKALSTFVKDWLEIKHGAQFIITGQQPNSIFTPQTFHGSLLAAVLDASE